MTRVGTVIVGRIGRTSIRNAASSDARAIPGLAHIRSNMASWRIVAGAAKAASQSGSVEAAKRYYRSLTELAAAGGDRPEISEARIYLAQN